MIVFPVKGASRFTDDFHKPRSGGRTHEGIDIFAARGTPVVAVDTGILRFQQNTLGGNAATVKTADGSSYYYAHLDSYEGESPRSVFPGMVIGYLGDTGNAKGTSPHLHFQISLKDEGTINPYAELMRVKTGAIPAAVEAVKSGLSMGHVVVGGILLGGAFLLIRRR